VILVKPGIKIGTVLLEWMRTIYRVFIFVDDCFLFHKVLPEVENSLLLYSQQNKIPLITIAGGESLHFSGQRYTLEEFIHHIDIYQPFKEFVLFVRPEAFQVKATARKAHALWMRSRKRGVPAFAVYTPFKDTFCRWDYRWEFETSAFTRFYLFDQSQKICSELLVQSDYIKSSVVQLDHNMVAICQEVVCQEKAI